jgi:hypothetical protein
LIRVVAYCLNTFLKGNYLVVASHDNHGPKLQTFGEVHGADRKVAAYGFHIFIENFEGQASFLCGVFRTIQFRFGADEHTELVRRDAGLCVLAGRNGWITPRLRQCAISIRSPRTNKRTGTTARDHGSKRFT